MTSAAPVATVFADWVSWINSAMSDIVGHSTHIGVAPQGTPPPFTIVTDLGFDHIGASQTDDGRSLPNVQVTVHGVSVGQRSVMRDRLLAQAKPGWFISETGTGFNDSTDAPVSYAHPVTYKYRD